MTYFEKHIEVSNQPSPNDTNETKPRNLQTKPKFNQKVRYKRKQLLFLRPTKLDPPTPIPGKNRGVQQLVKDLVVMY